MLNKLRNKKTAKKIWIILAIIVIPPFVLLWGPGSSIVRGKQKSGYVGKIFGRNIPISEYKDAYEAARNQAVLQYGDKFSEMQKYLNLESRAWDRLILLVQAKKNKIKATDKEVIEEIQGYPLFQNKGRFDSQIYSQLLEYVFRIQPRQFEEEIRQNLILFKLSEGITGNITVTETEIKEEYQKLNEEISMYYIAGLPSDFAKGITVSQEEVKEYFTKNSLQFKEPLAFNIEYTAINSENEDEKAVKDKINAVFARLSKNTDFSNAAKEFNLSVKETGFFGQTDPIPGIGWSQEISGVISKARVGDLLPPIYAEKYYYILRLKEKREPFIPGFETIKDKVKETLSNDKSLSAAKQGMENCLNKLKQAQKENPKSIDFEKAAKEFNLKSGETAFFKYGSYIEGIGASDNFFMQARNLKEDEFSPMINTPTGLYIIKLKAKKLIDEEKFTKEKAELSQRLLFQKKGEHFLKFLEDLKRRNQGF